MYLGIDLGTSGLKLLLLDDQHRVHATVDEALTLQRPQPLWCEQHPQDWWAALERAVAQLRAKALTAWTRVRGIGLSGQMHGAVALDANHSVLRPAILWNDGRSAAQCLTLEQAEPRSREITGNLAMPGFTAPKLQWMREHEPDLFAQISHVLLPKDWLRLQLTGDLVSDMSDASGTLWLDVGQRAWSPAMLDASGMRLAAMPRLVEGSEAGGQLRPALAAQWGLKPGVLVAGGGGDNAASAVGIGAVRAGEGFISLGTSGVAFLVGDQFSPKPEAAVHAFAHALPGTWHQMSVMLSAASAFGWVTQLTGAASEAALSAQTQTLTAIERDRAPLFLPYLNGERTPHNNPHASGVFMGLRAEHNASHLAYAVMEGVGFGLADGLHAMGASAGPLPCMALVGGGGRSAPWAQLLADLLNVPLHVPREAHAAAALGAARLAWMADGGKMADVCIQASADSNFVPDASRHASLQARYQRFRALYPALSPYMTDGADHSGRP